MPDENPVPIVIPEKKTKTWWQKIVAEIVDLAESFMEWSADGEVAAAIRADLGVDVDAAIPNAELPMSEITALREYAEATDVTAEAFAATDEQATAIITAIYDFVETLFDDEVDVDEVWDLLHKIFGIYVTETVRARSPIAYWLFKTVNLVHEQFGNVERFDLDGLGSLFNPDDDSENGSDGDGFTEFEATRWSDLFTFLVQQIVGSLILELGPNRGADNAVWLDSYYGWETPPEHETRRDVSVLERMWTIRAKKDAAGSAAVAVSFALVPEEHGGPGLFMSLGGDLTLSHEIGNRVLSIGTAMDGAVNAFIYTGDEHDDHWQVDTGSDIGQALSVSLRPKEADSSDEVDPIFRVEPGGKVKLEVQQIALKGDIAFGDANLGLQADILGASIVVRKDALSLLDKLLREDLELEFEAGIRWDPDNGVHLTNGSGFHTLVPLNRTAFGVTIHYIELGMHARENRAQSMEFIGATAVTLNIGPLKAQIERFGIKEYASWGAGERGYESGFQPPKGVALSINSGPVKGGGYLFIDPENNQYSGVLEITVGKLSLKAIGMLTTEVDGFPDDWAFFALVTAEAPIWGPLTGLGGIIGVHHGLSLEKLQDGVRSGILDSILFPRDPTANPAQVMNHIRAVFPVTPGSFTVGLMAKFSFFDDQLAIMLGLIVQWDDFLGADTDSSLNRVAVMGRLQILVPIDSDKPKVKIILDVVGSYDRPARLLSVDGRLRDSKIGAFTITGSGSVRDQGYRPSGAGLPAAAPSRIVTIGGWNPRFTDIPEGVPKQDRVGFSIKSKKGAKTKYEISCKAYYASTPNTTQIGILAKASGSRSGFSFSGTFGFDGIWYQNPDYFELDVKFGVSIKKGSTNLLTIDLELYIRGSGHWIVKGEGKIKILWWSIPIPIHEEWGSELPATTEEIRVEDELEAAIRDYRNWSAELPNDSSMLVTVRELTDGGIFAHPLGSLSFTQQVVPLGVEIDHFGQFEPSGESRFDITEVTVGGSPESTTDIKSYFSLNQFLDLTAAQRLTMPSFEYLDAGVVVNVDEDAIPALTQIVSAEPNYEVKYRRREMPPEEVVLEFDQVRVGATAGAAARSTLSGTPFGGGPRPTPVSVADPTVVVVARDTLDPVDDIEDRTYIAAAQRLTDRSQQIVEAHELETA